MVFRQIVIHDASQPLVVDRLFVQRHTFPDYFPES
jgi:hypothetical protein